MTSSQLARLIVAAANGCATSEHCVCCFGFRELPANEHGCRPVEKFLIGEIGEEHFHELCKKLGHHPKGLGCPTFERFTKAMVEVFGPTLELAKPEGDKAVAT